MLFSRRRSIGALFTSWVVYWLVVAVWKLGPAVSAIWKATRGPEDNKSNVSFNFANWIFDLIVNDHGRVTYSGSAHLMSIALWIAGVPLVLWLVWMSAARAPESSSREDVRQPV